jgi:hypothetical protein
MAERGDNLCQWPGRWDGQGSDGLGGRAKVGSVSSLVLPLHHHPNSSVPPSLYHDTTMLSDSLSEPLWLHRSSSDSVAQ